jgi:anti-sigma factor RsiW
MSCESCRDRLVDRLAGELSEEDAVLLNQHLAECAACSREEEQLRQLFAAARAGDSWRESGGLRGSLLEALEREASLRRTSGGRAFQVPAVLALARRPVSIYAALGLLVAGLASGFWLGRSRAHREAPATPMSAPEAPWGGTALAASGPFTVAPGDAIRPAEAWRQEHAVDAPAGVDR